MPILLPLSYLPAWSQLRPLPTLCTCHVLCRGRCSRHFSHLASPLHCPSKSCPFPSRKWTLTRLSRLSPAYTHSSSVGGSAPVGAISPARSRLLGSGSPAPWVPRRAVTPCALPHLHLSLHRSLRASAWNHGLPMCPCEQPGWRQHMSRVRASWRSLGRDKQRNPHRQLGAFHLHAESSTAARSKREACLGVRVQGNGGNRSLPRFPAVIQGHCIR